jgi:glycosyltransferase involved in cell wall biosynthesis
VNILMVHPHDIHSRFEPWTVRIVYLAREFEKKGHKVKLVYFPLEFKAHKPVELSRGITEIPFCRRHSPFILFKNIISMCKLAGWADVVHFQKCFYNAAVPAMMAALIRGRHLHYDWDDWELKIYEVSTQPGFLRNIVRDFIRILENRIPAAVDSVSVASNRLKVECAKLVRGSIRICDAHVGADILRFNPGISGQQIRKEYGIDKPLVLYLGQLHGGQYVELFIRTAARLLNEYKKDLVFMIVGDGYMAEELKKKAAQLNLGNSLIFTGSVSHESVPKYIAAADVCVACFEENDVTCCKSPLKIVEYLASGKAIVASNVGEVPLMLKDAGVVVEAGNSDALCQGIIRVVEDRSLRENLEKKARLRAIDEYNWTVTASNLLQVYCLNNRIKQRA